MNFIHCDLRFIICTSYEVIWLFYDNILPDSSSYKQDNRNPGRIFWQVCKPLLADGGILL